MHKISIIIPCYNHGHYLEEAIQSIHEANNGQEIEIIIVNDGSTDAFTIQKLQELDETDVIIIHKQNAGLSAARNTGIQNSSGTLILPLDADNKLSEIGLSAPLNVFNQHPEIGIVYGDRLLFGVQTKQIEVGDFNLQKLMLGNYIDACAMFKKEIWENVSGYDEQMLTGWEDWEFWLHAAFKGSIFYYLPQVLFSYRVVTNSMVHNLNKSKQKSDDIILYISKKHNQYFGPQYVDQYIFSKFEKSAVGSWSKLFLRQFFPKKFKKMVSAGKLRRYW
jgi:glycosyltransferase involved in cell wall biosynthesis